MVEKKECERPGLRVKKRKNGENHDRVKLALTSSGPRKRPFVVIPSIISSS